MHQRFEELHNVLPVVHENGNEGAQVEQHVKEQAAVCGGQAKEVLKQGQVARAGDGEKLRHPLDQSQENGG